MIICFFRFQYASVNTDLTVTLSFYIATFSQYMCAQILDPHIFLGVAYDHPGPLSISACLTKYFKIPSSVTTQ